MKTISWKNMSRLLSIENDSRPLLVNTAGLKLSSWHTSLTPVPRVHDNVGAAPPILKRNRKIDTYEPYPSI